MRPQLRPGLHVLRRDVHTVQLGLDWPGVVVLPDSPALQAVLAAVDGIRDITAVVLTAARRAGVDEPECRAALDVLLDCGALVDRCQQPRGAVTEAAWASAWLLAGPDGRASDVLAARRERSVEVWGEGQVAERVSELLPRGGLRVAERQADVVVVASDHEPSRSISDLAMSDGRPHLWAVVRELVGVVGPLVDPGRTACLRCIDQARSESDPAWPTLVESSAARRARVHACDPMLATLVACWTVQELAVWASDQRAQTLGRTVEIPLGTGVVEATRFDAHPTCGCGWPQWQDTMGA